MELDLNSRETQLHAQQQQLASREYACSLREKSLDGLEAKVYLLFSFYRIVSFAEPVEVFLYQPIRDVLTHPF